MPSEMPRVAAIVLAGGSGTRFAAPDGANKVYVDLAGRPLISWCLETLDADPRVALLVVARRADDEPLLRRALDLAALRTPLRVVNGGASRTASEFNALEAVRPEVADHGVDLIAIHDGARPFVSSKLLDRVIRAAAEHGAAIPGLAIDEPVLEASPGDHHAVAVDRTRLVRVQTPQVFTATELLEAYDRAARDAFQGLDTAEVFASCGGSIKVVEGDAENLKVTTPFDIERASAIALARTKGRIQDR